VPAVDDDGGFGRDVIAQQGPNLIALQEPITKNRRFRSLVVVAADDTNISQQHHRAVTAQRLELPLQMFIQPIQH